MVQLSTVLMLAAAFTAASAAPRHHKNGVISDEALFSDADAAFISRREPRLKHKASLDEALISNADEGFISRREPGQKPKASLDEAFISDGDEGFITRREPRLKHKASQDDAFISNAGDDFITRRNARLRLVKVSDDSKGDGFISKRAASPRLKAIDNMYFASDSGAALKLKKLKDITDDDKVAVFDASAFGVLKDESDEVF